MNDELRKSVFIQARDRFMAAGQWLGIAIVVLLIFHILTLQPFISLSHQVEQADAHSQQLAQVQPNFQQLEAAIQSLQPYREQIAQATNETTEVLIQDFERLSQEIEAVRASDPSAAIAPDSAETAETDDDLEADEVELDNIEIIEDTEDENQPSTSPVQQPLQSTADDQIQSTEFTLTPALAEEVRQTAEIDALRGVLTPYIRREIVDPRFAQLNYRLQDIATEVESKVDDIQVQTEAIQRQVKTIPVANDIERQIAQIQTQTEEMKGLAATLEAQPPADNDWWASADEKTAVTQAIASVTADSLLPTSLETVTSQLNQDFDALLSQQQGLQAELAQAIAQLEADFAAQQEKLAGLGTPLQWIALDLTFAAARFPLLLAGILAALLWLQSRRLMALVEAIRFQPPPHQDFWDWFFHQTRGLITGFSPRSLKQVRENPLPVVFLAWVGIAAFNVSWLDQVSWLAALLMLLVAWGFLLLAFEHRQRVWRQVLHLSRRETNPTEQSAEESA